MPYVEANGQRIFYRERGSGSPPVVLAHGWLMDSAMFEPQLEGLSDHHRVIAWDCRGHGETQGSLEPFSYWELADDLRALLDALGIERAVVGGMSQGGFIGLRFALRYPERTAGLVLIDSQAGLEAEDKRPQYDVMLDVWVSEGPTDELAEMVAAIIIGNQRPESAEWIKRWKHLPPERLQQIYRTLMDRDDVTPRLSEIDAPAVVIHGDQDAAIELDRADALAEGLRGAGPVVRVRGAGHASNLTHPHPVNAAIERFLRGL